MVSAGPSEHPQLSWEIIYTGISSEVLFPGFPLSCNNFFSVCIFIGTHQSVIARGGYSGVLGLLAALFLRFLFGLQSYPNFPFFPYEKFGIAPWFMPSSVGGVVFISVGFFRETLSLGLDLVFCFFLGLMFSPVSQREMNLDWLVSFVFGAWEERGVSCLNSLFGPLGNFFEVFVFLFARTYWFL